MSRFPIAVSALTLLLSACPALLAADAAPAAKKDGTFRMGEVTVAVSADMDPIETANTKVTAEDIQQLNRDSLSNVLATLPGVSLSMGGARNEAMFYLRGNDPRQTPVFVDGLPCYIPYDGNIDYSRFTTFDVAEIQVAKGFSSIAYGANTLGGAINVVTRRPVTEMEGDVRAGLFDGKGRTAAFNVGSNQGAWYVQGGVSKTQADYQRMSSHYVPTATEDGGNRENSYFHDRKISAKLGYTPNATDEYAIGVVRQRGDKGGLVDTTATVSGARYWRWPNWDMDSTFLATNTALGAKSYFKSHVYFNRYVNGIDSYTNGTYTTLKTSGSGAMSPYGHSHYKDFSSGVMLEFGSMVIAKNSLKFIAQTKNDVHREGTDAYPDTALWPHYQDKYVILGAEDTITLSPSMDLSLGAGWDQMKPIAAGSFTVSNAKSYFHGQGGFFWKLSPATKVYATIAQKDHFATLKDRYSYKMGSADPNPALKPEHSLNYEVGVRSILGSWMTLEASLFKSDITDLIQSVYVRTDSSNNKIYQSQNIGKVEHSGIEVSIGGKPNKYIQANMGYTYIDRTNKSSSTPLIGTPKNRVTGYLRVDPTETVYFQTTIQAQQHVCDSTTPTYVSGFITADAAIGYKPTTAVSLEGGLKNVTDENYQYSTGYPQPGRTWFVNARYKF